MMRIEVVEADITALVVDAIVNAANESLLGGGGVDGAIHRAAGMGLLDECRALPQLRRGVRCPTGEARITGGHLLSARHVILAVGPVWEGGGDGEAALLAGCYRASLQLAATHGLASIAFPAISCGVFGYPHAEAAKIAIQAIQAWREPMPRRTVLCCFDAGMADRYRALLAP